MSSPQAVPPAARGAVSPHRAPHLLFLVFLALLAAVEALVAQPATVRVAIVTDGPTDRAVFSRRARSPAKPPRCRRRRRRDRVSRARARPAIGRWPARPPRSSDALSAPDVDVVLALGMLALATGRAAQRRLPKPVIAPFVADPCSQRYPLAAGTSGRTQFRLHRGLRGHRRGGAHVPRVVRFRHLAALVDEALLRAMPELARESRAGGRRAVGADLARSDRRRRRWRFRGLAGRSADAVYVTGLLRLKRRARAARGRLDRRAAAVVLGDRPHGARERHADDDGRGRARRRALARRVVLMIERIARGEDPRARSKWVCRRERRLAINMRTAAAIGFSPQLGST